MASYYELPDALWEQVADLFSAPQRNGRPRYCDRQMLNGVIWAFRSRLGWRRVPPCYGHWATVYQRYRDWNKRNAFTQMCLRLGLPTGPQAFCALPNAAEAGVPAAPLHSTREV